MAENEKIYSILWLKFHVCYILLTFLPLLCFYGNSTEELQKSRLKTLNCDYALELQIICEEFDLERTMLIEQHFSEMNDIADILFAMEENFQERENEARGEFQSLRDEIKNKVRNKCGKKSSFFFVIHYYLTTSFLLLFTSIVCVGKSHHHSFSMFLSDM